MVKNFHPFLQLKTLHMQLPEESIDEALSILKDHHELRTLGLKTIQNQNNLMNFLPKIKHEFVEEVSLEISGV